MALATRCPHCQTTFRVAHDQLKLRAGLVRCGACKEIFNGVEHLLGPEAMQQVFAKPSPPLPQPGPGTGAAPPQDEAPLPTPQASPGLGPIALSPADTPGTKDAQPEQTDAATTEEKVPDFLAAHAENHSTGDHPQMPPADTVSDETTITDPLQRMTLMDFTAYDTRHADGDFADGSEHPERVDSAAATAGEQEARDELSAVIDDLHNKPWRSEKSRKLRRGAAGNPEKAGKAEPGFMASARRQKRYGKTLRLTMGIGSAVLLLALLMQSVFAFRDTIAAKLPEYRPVLTDLCKRLGCQVKLPARIDKVSIESSELQSLPSSPNRFTLAALLRNQASSDQAWPYLELTLNDMNEKPVARKVFQPSDYLVPSPQAVASGFPAQSEQPIKVSFELLDLKASGYRVYLFYP